MNEHCAFLRAGDITAIVGDDVKRGWGDGCFSGLWSLYHTACLVSPFQNCMAGLISNFHRGTQPTLEIVDETTARLVRTPYEGMPHATVTGTYALREPHYVDYTLDVAFEPDAKNIPEQIECIWASYMNSPRDSSIYFLENGVWAKFSSDIHGMNASVLPAGLDDAYRQNWERRSDENRFRDQEWFWRSYSGRTFDYPFYFGQLHNMTMLFMADSHRDFRIFVSPTGGNYSCIPGNTSPAWDFSWIIWNAKPGEVRTFHLRLAWFLPRPWDTCRQVWEEWEKFREIYPIRGS